jgi:prophage antirepressor-like protein
MALFDKSLYINMDSLSVQFIKILENLLEDNGFECKKMVFRNKKYNKNEIYYYARDVLRCLNCTDKAEASQILNRVEENNKFTISELYEIYSSKALKHVFGLNQELVSKLKEYEMKYVYVNKIGLYQLILFSEKPKSIPFKDFIFKILLTTLNNNYQDLLSKDIVNINEISKINNQIFQEIKEIKSMGYSLLNNNE